MPWVKLDDQFPDNPKIDTLSDGAFRLYVAGLCYVGKYELDGMLPAERVPRLVPRHRHRQVVELLNNGLWIQHGDVYEIHDWADYQKSKAWWEDRRKKTNARVQQWRDSHRSGDGQWHE